MSGVPLALYHEMNDKLKKHFALDAELAQNWNLYMAATGSGKAYTKIVNDHLKLYYQ